MPDVQLKIFDRFVGRTEGLFLFLLENQEMEFKENDLENYIRQFSKKDFLHTKNQN